MPAAVSWYSRRRLPPTTDQDPAISAFLDQYHSPGVPLYVGYPAGGGEGRRLPQLLSMSLMHEQLEGGAH